MACELKRDPEIEKAFWNEAKGHLARGMEPEDVIGHISKQHGIGTDAVGSILAQNRQLFQLTNEAWAKQAKLSELRSEAKRTIQSADKSALSRVIKFPYEAPRQLLTIGHGGVIPFTHARTSLFVPGEAKIFLETVRDAYSYLTPNTGSARWRADMTRLRSDPGFKFWTRVGLEIKVQTKPVGMGMSRWTRQSFDAVKTMRLKLAKKYWSQLDPADRSFEMAKDLAKRINHATGTISSPPIVNKLAGATMFAPKLRFSKYASVVDSVSTKFGARRFAKLLAVNLGLLAINDMVNRHILKTDDRVNWTDPTRSDWLRLKVAGMTIPLAPLFEAARLPIRLAVNQLDPRERDKWRVAGQEVASAAHPAISIAYGVVTGKDLATQKALPFRGLSQRIYGDYRSEKRGEISKGEYAAGHAPIPFQPVLKEMAKEGIPPDLSEKFLRIYAESILSGALGTHAHETPPERPPKKYPKKR